MNEDIILKEDLLNELRAYATTPDDETTQYKEKIRQTLLKCPELLYALHEEELEQELFIETKDENNNTVVVLNIDAKTGEMLGEVDRYFGTNSNIRPMIFVPQTQDKGKHYVCYQVMFDELPKYNDVQKYTQIIFTIFVDGDDREDELTGLPRHDLIASIIRKRFNWSNIFGMQTHIISSKESTTDNNFVVRTIVFQLVDTNGIVDTKNNTTSIYNHRVRR